MPIGNSVVIEGQTANIISPTWPIVTGSGAVLASGGPLFAAIIKAPLTSGASGLFIGGTSPNLANAGGAINANNGAGLFMTPDDNLTIKINNFNKISIATFVANSGISIPIIGLQSP